MQPWGRTLLNGLETLSYDGVNDYSTVSPNYSGSKITVAMVHRYRSGGDAWGRHISAGDGAQVNDYQNTTGFMIQDRKTNSSLEIYYNSSQIGPDLVHADLDWMITLIQFDSATVKARHNGAEVGSVAQAGNFNIKSLRLGAPIFASSSMRGQVGVADLYVIGDSFSDATLERLEGWLAHKYALTSILPAGHPYKTTAPTT